MWKFQSQGDGYKMQLLHDGVPVLTIDESRVKIESPGFRKDTVIGCSEWPSWENQKLIECLLNCNKAEREKP